MSPRQMRFQIGVLSSGIHTWYQVPRLGISGAKKPWKADGRRRQPQEGLVWFPNIEGPRFTPGTERWMTDGRRQAPGLTDSFLHRARGGKRPVGGN